MKRPNVLLIVVDALRARNLGCYGYHKQTSPNIDNMANEGLLFENAFSCATTTYPSLTSIFSGRYPRSHGVNKQAETRSQLLRQTVQRLNKSQTVFLAEILKSKGYVTSGVDWIGRWTKRGFDYYSGDVTSRNEKVYSLLMRINKVINSQIIRNLLIRSGKLKVYGRNVTREATKFIERFHSKKFFLFAHYWDTHTTYDPPKSYVKKFVNYGHYNDLSLRDISNHFTSRHLRKRILPGLKTVGEVLARYDGAISYLDDELGRLIETLEDYGILDRTLIILTSDHGESLTEHGIYFCHHGLYDVTVHVPLIIRYRDFPRGKKIKGLVQHTDILPTILDALNIESRNLVLDGRSTIPLIFDDVKQLRKAVYIEEAETERKAAVRTDRYKYIYSPSLKEATCRECGCIHGGVEELYDLKQDPEEISNIARKNYEQVDKLKENLFRWMRHREVKIRRKIKEKEFEDFSPEEEKKILERLRELGYVD